MLYGTPWSFQCLSYVFQMLRIRHWTNILNPNQRTAPVQSCRIRTRNQVMQEIRQGEGGILREIRAKWQVSDVGQPLGMDRPGELTCPPLQPSPVPVLDSGPAWKMSSAPRQSRTARARLLVSDLEPLGPSKSFQSQPYLR